MAVNRMATVIHDVNIRFQRVDKRFANYLSIFTKEEDFRGVWAADMFAAVPTRRIALKEGFSTINPDNSHKHRLPAFLSICEGVKYANPSTLLYRSRLLRRHITAVPDGVNHRRLLCLLCLHLLHFLNVRLDSSLPILGKV